MPAKGVYKSIEVRFWKYVKKTDSCWLWIGAKRDQKRGYGTIVDNTGKNFRAHRVSWEMHNGQIPDGLFVLHKCDNPSCVNPDHLFLGTQTDNMQDMLRKNRGNQQKGEGNGRSKLTEKDVLLIRKQYASGGITQKKIGEFFGVSNVVISNVVGKKSWAHI